MNLKIRYQKPCEDIHEGPIQLHKNSKGYNVQIEGKFYFPKPDNPVLQNEQVYQNKELWVVIIDDKVNYGHISFALADFFIKTKDKTVEIEKEIPLNQIDNPDEPFIWDYEVIASCKSIDETDLFIENAENQGCPESIIKEAIKEFYALQKN